jgi:hypothetical protein
MDLLKQLTRPSSWMVYLSLLLTFTGRHFFASGSARYVLMTAGTAALAGAVMNVLQDVRKRDAQMCAVRKNKAAN